MNLLKPLIATAAALAVGLGAAAAQGAAQAALAIDVAGSTNPAVEPFSELNVGDKFELGTDGQITFLHYASCEEVVVKGGRLLFTERQYLLQKGQIVEKKRTRCPKQVALKSDARIGGVRIRGGSATRLESQPHIVLTGQALEKYAAIRFLDDADKDAPKVLYEDPISSPRYTWPEGRSPLAGSEPGDGRYVLVLVPRGDAEPLRVKFYVKDGGPVTVIRVD